MTPLATELATLDVVAQADLVRQGEVAPLELRLAGQLEAARPWADRRPPVHA